MDDPRPGGADPADVPGDYRPDGVDEGFRTGASLIADADTQALHDDFHGKKQGPKGKLASHFHAQEISADQVGDVDEKFADERDTADTAITHVDPRYQWNPAREYFHGWTEPDGRIALLYRTETGARKKELVDYPYYFFVRAEDVKRLPQEKWDWVIKKRRWADRMEPDPVYPDRYWRIYCDRALMRFKPANAYARIGQDTDSAFSWAVPFFLGERPTNVRFPMDRDKWKPFHILINWLNKNDVEPLEADLSPKQRFMTDYDLNIQAKYRMMYFDLETDDSVGGFDKKEESRILSIAWQGDRFEKDPSDSGFLLLEEETDEAEERMLREFRDRMWEYDVLVAWNGGGFDFPVLIARFHKLGIRVDWRRILFADPLPVFKRHYIRAGSQGTSYSLDSIGQVVLKIPKIDWRPGFKKRHPDVPPRIIELYRREPELLEEYNVRDVLILRKLEEFTGFVNIEQIFCRIGCGFANDWNISTKIDQLLLKKGFQEGHHFTTRYWKLKKPEQYTGAYVFPPVVGFHRNVGAFDFKSLYPSMVRAFNISPETVVKAWDRDKFDPADLCTCPRFVDDEAKDEDGEPLEGVEVGGSTFRRDREGFISQMFINTLERRKKYTDLQGKRLEITGTTQDDLYLLYYRLAYSFKRLGLSFYGDIGNPNSRYYDTEVAEAITLSGQFFIKETAKYARELGYAPLYGDTDSIYIRLAPDDVEWESEEARLEHLIRVGDEFVDYCQERYLKILKELNCNLDWNAILLEYEDVYDRIFFIVKKRYAGKMIRHKGVATEHVEVKGLEVMRGDSSAMTRRLQQKVLDAILLNEWDGERIAEEIVAPEFDLVAGGQLPIADIAISKSISKDPSEYKTTPLHVRLGTWIRDYGQQFFIGMKVEYVVTAAKPKLDGKLVDHWDPEVDRYDPEYYWDRVIYPATQRVLETCFPELDWEAWLIAVRQRRRKLVERYRRWLRDPKKVKKAVEQIRENKGGRLGPAEIEELRRAPRAKVAVPGTGMRRTRRRRGPKQEAKA